MALKRTYFRFLLNSQERLLKEMDSNANSGLRIAGAHNSPMEKKLCLKAFFFRPDIESSVKLCHKTSLNWNFSWRNDKVIYLATEGKSSLEVKGWNVF